MSIFNILKFITNHPLNKDHKIESVVRFIRWQIGSRLVPGEVVYEWIDGVKFIVNNGETGLTGNIYCGLHEFNDMAFLLHVLDKNDLFIDIGANVGSYTLLACGVRGAKGVCFEPVKSTYDRLYNNILINHLSDNVTSFNAGVSDDDGELSFTTDEGCCNHVVEEPNENINVEKVKVYRLDSVLEDENPSVMKIDVEGFEDSVINGAENILRRDSLHSIIMELNDSGSRYGVNENSILQKMKEYGFGTYSYDPFSRKLLSLHGKNYMSGNTIFIRDVEHVQNIVNNSAPVLIGKVAL